MTAIVLLLCLLTGIISLHTVLSYSFNTNSKVAVIKPLFQCKIVKSKVILLSEPLDSFTVNTSPSTATNTSKTFDFIALLNYLVSTSLQVTIIIAFLHFIQLFVFNRIQHVNADIIKVIICFAFIVYSVISDSSII